MADGLRAGDPGRLGAYRLTGRLGEGGQGVVFLGEAPGGGPVAVKLLRTGLGHDPEARARFLRELETAKKVARFCTAAVLDAEIESDQPFIVSEFVDGPSLHHVVRNEGPRAGGVLERLAVGTATALVAIHQAGVVHRDFKPHNVLIGPDGPRVIDFGIARALDGATITSSGAIGTPAYMAPELISGERAGPAADVFAWAATLVFASAGRPPFGDDSLHAVIHRVLNEEPDLGSLTGTLREVVTWCLAKDPALRPPASEALRTLLGESEPRPTGTLSAATLHAGAAAVSGTAPPPPPRLVGLTVPPYPPQRPPIRRGSGVVAVSAAVVAVAAAVVVSVVVLSNRDDGGGTQAQTQPPTSTSTTRTSKPTRSPTPSASGATGFPGGYAGNWSGRLQQSDGKTIAAFLSLPPGARRGSISYPGQRCSGVAALTGRGGGRLTLIERITVGADRCVDSGTITLTRGAAGLGFSYTGTEKGRTWAVAGTMSRTG